MRFQHHVTRAVDFYNHIVVRLELTFDVACADFFRLLEKNLLLLGLCQGHFVTFLQELPLNVFRIQCVFIRQTTSLGFPPRCAHSGQINIVWNLHKTYF